MDAVLHEFRDCYNLDDWSILTFTTFIKSVEVSSEVFPNPYCMDFNMKAV